MAETVRRWFPSHPEAVSEARRWVGEVLGSGHPRLAPTVELLVTELATNAVRYAGGEHFLVRVVFNSHVVTAAVCDADPTNPVPLASTAAEIGGRGLAMRSDALSR